MDNRHQTAIPEALLNEINGQVDSIIEKLKPYAVTVSAQKRRDILKMGDKSLAFVSTANKLAHGNPDLFPNYLSLSGFDVDFNGARNTLGLLNRLRRLTQMVDDTAMVAGSEASQAALAFYNSLQAAVKARVEGAKTLYAELKACFPRVKRRPTPKTDSPETE
jgi:hypothetical protein